MLNILISGVYIKPNKVGGVQSYLINLLKGFKQLEHDFKIDLIIRTEASKLFDFILDDRRFTIIPIEDTLLSINRVLWERIKLPQYINKTKPDVVFLPNYYVPSNIKIPVITTIHDLQFIKYPQYFSNVKRIWLNYSTRYCSVRSDHIVAISNFTKDDLQSHYLINKQKVSVIYNPIEIKDKEENFVILPSNYIMAVAQQYPHKNLKTLLKAFTLLPDNMHLVLVGQYDKATKQLQELVIEENTMSRIIFTGYVSDAELQYIYKNAELFVLPSLFEGFGMPLIEAMLNKIPVVTTNLTAIPEVTLGKARYVSNPLDHKELAYTIMEVLDNRLEWIPTDNTLEQLKTRYSPSNIAKQYYDLFLLINEEKA